MAPKERGVLRDLVRVRLMDLEKTSQAVVPGTVFDGSIPRPELSWA